MQVIVKGKGGSIETMFLDDRPASCTVDLFIPPPEDATDTTVPTQKVTAAVGVVDAVNTTLSDLTEEGSVSVVVASATGITVGRRYKLAGTGEVDETVTVKGIDGTTIMLWAPTLFRHASGATFKGVRVSYTVLAAAADIVWSSGYAVFTPNTGNPITEHVDCALTVIPDALCDMTDVRAEYPQIVQWTDRELDLLNRLRAARDEFLLDLGNFYVRYALGVREFRRPAALKFLLLNRHSFGDRAATIMERIEKDYLACIARLKGNQPADVDQDGIPNEPEDLTAILAMEAV